MKTIKTTETIKVENYPYGGQRTDKFYSVEFKASKGFRSVTQTVNPKTGRLNKPKKSTYSALRVLCEENERITTHTEDFYDDKGKDRGYKFMFDNFDLFTLEEIKGTALYNIMLLKADVYAKTVYCGSDVEKLMPLYDKAMEALREIALKGANLWNEVKIDWQAVEALEVEGYQPFKKTTYSMKTS